MRPRSDRDELLESAALEESGSFGEVYGGADVSRYEDEFASSRGGITGDLYREMLFVRSHRFPIRMSEDHRDRVTCLSGYSL